MHCSLVDLSDDLLWKIIQKLLDHDHLLHEKSMEQNAQQKNRDRDDEFLYHQDLLSWSCTSQYFRNLLAPYIFRTIKLRNDEKSGASVDTLLRSPHGDLVKAMYFLGNIPPGLANPDDTNADAEPLPEGFYKLSYEAEEEEEKPITITLPPIVGNLLSDLNRFPNLESLSIGFTYPYDSPFDEWHESQGLADNERPEAVRLFEALIMTTYETLLRNKAPQLRAVEIRKFMWTFTEPYESQKFHEFLGNVKHFSLSVRGGKDYIGMCINTRDVYLECVARFDELFFEHLASATSLTLQAPHDGPVGLQGKRHARLALKGQQMPLLSSLDLERIFICQELVDSIASHTDTLQRLTLRRCISSVNGLQENDPFYWSHFFDAMQRADLKQLSDLEIWPRDSWDEAMGHKFYRVPTERAEPENVQQSGQAMNAKTRRRVFEYALLLEKYGYCVSDVAENGTAYVRGKDQVAFDNLMAKVNANAAKGVGKLSGSLTQDSAPSHPICIDDPYMSF